MEIRLRAARPDDADFLLALRNHPTIRAASFQTAPIALADHRRWLDTRLQDPYTRLWIIESSTADSKPIGQVRLNYNRDFAQAEIHIALHPDWHGKGQGHQALQQACILGFAEYESLEAILAFIQPDNLASQRAFAKSGFAPQGESLRQGHACQQWRYPRPPSLPLLRDEVSSNQGIR